VGRLSIPRKGSDHSTSEVEKQHGRHQRFDPEGLDSSLSDKGYSLIMLSVLNFAENDYNEFKRCP
jgi:hypothetical protein